MKLLSFRASSRKRQILFSTLQTIPKVFMIIYVYNTYDSNSIFNYSRNKRNYNEKRKNIKYILQWTAANTEPFIFMGIGQKGFIDRICPYTNCFVTSDRRFFNDYRNFDVILFAGPQIVQDGIHQRELPQKRSPHQKYVFSSIESPIYYPIHDAYFDNYFNWTWTYKVDSDLIWGYITIKDKHGNTIGPKKSIEWLNREKMLPVTYKLRKALKRKSLAAAWLVSNCDTRSKREQYVAKLNMILQKKYNMTVDIYGKCGKTCKNCDELIKRHYFFYLAFENSFSEDYVTEKLSRALENNAIPIVYGGADYSRFLPKGSYLNARELGVEKLARKMNELIKDFNKYTEYFRWTNHYQYYRRNDRLKTNDYCNMCSLLNNRNRMEKVSTHKHFRDWWNK